MQNNFFTEISEIFAAKDARFLETLSGKKIFLSVFFFFFNVGKISNASERNLSL